MVDLWYFRVAYATKFLDTIFPISYKYTNLGLMIFFGMIRTKEMPIGTNN